MHNKIKPPPQEKDIKGGPYKPTIRECLERIIAQLGRVGTLDLGYSSEMKLYKDGLTALQNERNGV